MKREIKAKQALKDIRSGMDDLTLMEKYKITDKGLTSLFKKLVGAGLMSQRELDGRDSTFVSTVTLDFEDLGPGR
jgi:hypothetical protein